MLSRSAFCSLISCCRHYPAAAAAATPAAAAAWGLRACAAAAVEEGVGAALGRLGAAASRARGGPRVGASGPQHQLATPSLSSSGLCSPPLSATEPRPALSPYLRHRAAPAGRLLRLGSPPTPAEPTSSPRRPPCRRCHRAAASPGRWQQQPCPRGSAGLAWPRGDDEQDAEASRGGGARDRSMPGGVSGKPPPSAWRRRRSGSCAGRGRLRPRRPRRGAARAPWSGLGAEPGPAAASWARESGGAADAPEPGPLVRARRSRRCWQPSPSFSFSPSPRSPPPLLLLRLQPMVLAAGLTMGRVPRMVGGWARRVWSCRRRRRRRSEPSPCASSPHRLSCLDSPSRDFRTHQPAAATDGGVFYIIISE